VVVTEMDIRARGVWGLRPSAGHQTAARSMAPVVVCRR